ncbi:homoserine O-acetyltransferase [Caldibacillus lycopersici]|uniref:Homoserine O-acetyltransferase n=1 Tax=Perspicuibacillus lycopersici TaxID=1325689 RepID=A0AAE3IWW3_9BACI|nr:homoserine O-acetyltransferase [Perspicuibacillus lycopersici]MCU9615078.1 homoserine O-acetyltransferase [Perspicuibacillus lycopersici]
MVLNSSFEIVEHQEVSIGDLLLENGTVLSNAVAKYERVGNRNGQVVLVCHALTGNEQTVGTNENPGWWSGLVGRNRPIDTNLYQVITFNVLGGCHGSTGPQSINEVTGERYRAQFPFITIRDMVHFQKQALEVLGINQLRAVIGGSLGGMQALEWGLLYPNSAEHIIALAVTPYVDDIAIAYNRIGIEAIENDPLWNNGNYWDGAILPGLKIARMIGMVTYRSDYQLEERFQRSLQRVDAGKKPFYAVESYLIYQGDKLAAKFDPNSYLTLLYAMNSHDIGRDRGGFQKACQSFLPRLTLIGFQNDLLYKPEKMKVCQEIVPNANFFEVETKFGHDGFLVEFGKWGSIIYDCLQD